MTLSLKGARIPDAARIGARLKHNSTGLPREALRLHHSPEEDGLSPSPFVSKAFVLADTINRYR